MDPLTHTLVGANLAATRLGEKTRFAAAALVVGANLPDVDAILYFAGDSDFALEFRRGWTHGLLALFVLPFVQTALLLALDHLRPNASRRANPRWLLILSTIAIWSHPALDWLNTYGMRWLMPFDGTWFYGDSVYIMDPWLWLVLGTGWLIGRRASIPTVIVWAVFALAIARVVGRRSPEYLIVVGIVALVLLVALLIRPFRTRTFATGALLVAALYIGTRVVIHELTERAVAAEVKAERMMIGPHPMNPLQWNVLAQRGDHYRYGEYRWGRGLAFADELVPVANETPECAAARGDPSVRGLVTWMRFPACEIERTPDGTRVKLWDARRRGGTPRVVTVN